MFIPIPHDHLYLYIYIYIYIYIYSLVSHDINLTVDDNIHQTYVFHIFALPRPLIFFIYIAHLIDTFETGYAAFYHLVIYIQIQIIRVCAFYINVAFIFTCILCHCFCFVCALHRMTVLHWLDFHDMFEFMFIFSDNAGIISLNTNKRCTCANFA